MDLKVDINDGGDLVFVNGATPVSTSEADVVAQRVAIRLRTFRSEWFLDESYGVPWFEILGTKKKAGQIDHILQREVLSVPGVRSIEDWTSEVLPTREYNCSFVIKTTNGGLTDRINITPPST